MTVEQRYGRPDAVVPWAGGTRLQYSRQPAGQSAVMADLDATGHLLALREVMNPQNFARVEIDRWTREDTLRELGRPARIDRVASWNGDILTYRWLDSGVQNMMFFVYLDGAGVVRRTGQAMEYRNRFIQNW